MQLMGAHTLLAGAHIRSWEGGVWSPLQAADWTGATSQCATRTGWAGPEETRAEETKSGQEPARSAEGSSDRGVGLSRKNGSGVPDALHMALLGSPYVPPFIPAHVAWAVTMRYNKNVALEEIDMPNQPRFNEQKTTEATAIFLDLNGGKMNYMKLLKLLYLTDRKAFKEWERPITYDSYVSMKFGPVLSSTYDLIKGSFAGSKYWSNYIATEKYEVILKDKPPKIKKLSQAEIDLIKEIFKEYGKHNKYKLSRITHSLP